MGTSCSPLECHSDAIYAFCTTDASRCTSSSLGKHSQYRWPRWSGCVFNYFVGFYFQLCVAISQPAFGLFFDIRPLHRTDSSNQPEYKCHFESNVHICIRYVSAHPFVSTYSNTNIASSTQRQTALAQYWTSVLLRRPEDLVIFKTAISASPIMLPFDAFSSAVRSLYVSSPSSSFPPPLSCFPELGDSLLQAINTVESNAFGLQTASKTDQFNPQCYPDRPVYGVLNILRLRLPFLDSETGVDRQAVVLTKDASVRAILYNGQLFSTISNTSAPFPGVSSVQSNPLQFGTIDQLDHVILQYLSSIPDINTANNLIQFVLNTTNTASVPPDTTSPLFNSLSVLPSLGVAVFGAVQSADLTSTVSPFITPSNSLFFGSPDGSALRNWTINSSSGSIIWTQNATSALVAHDSSLDAQASISKIWEAASLAIAFNVTSITLGNITRSLQGTDSLTSQWLNNASSLCIIAMDLFVTFHRLVISHYADLSFTCRRYADLSINISNTMSLHTLVIIWLEIMVITLYVINNSG